ncbi:MAG: hypothetical protein Homavirus35_1 [Homavirus sp.]|uniref:E2 ubiquitin-conjugating enzyme n=1 Tax=Homavirus sp. TaxID=2487769 RepID=A0A3G5A521_9VIRU|nr:MAG: hypothetical protein Homavirus35_1 [Homavirus sp.]
MSRTPVRINKELLGLKNDPVVGLSVEPINNDFRYLNVIIDGPPDTPYEGGVFQLEMYLPQEYPLEPPKVRFLTKVYHPNIDRLGRICLNILKGSWTPVLQIRSVLISIQVLLSSPNPEDALDQNVAQHWIKNKVSAENKAREWTKLYAKV